MSRTLHRRDISREELNLLARFCHALEVIQGPNGRLPWVLGEVEIWLPVWFKAGEWKLATYKLFRKQALGLEVPDFRRVCRFLQVKESELVRTLYRLSMLAVLPQQKHYESPKFRMSFCGQPVDLQYMVPPTEVFGFVLERRRCEGNFR